MTERSSESHLDRDGPERRDSDSSDSSVDLWDEQDEQAGEESETDRQGAASNEKEPAEPAQGEPGAEPPPQEPGPRFNLLDSVAEKTRQIQEKQRGLLERFLSEHSPGRALALWLCPQLAGRPAKLSTDDVVRILNRDIARIDALLCRQVNAILHHPRFQRLEASWRGLQFLVSKIDPDEEPRIVVRMLSVTWKELSHDVTRAIEFDQSQLFAKIYSEEFGMAGGEPYGVLLGDYEVRHKVGRGHKIDDIDTLAAISHVAAAAFAPFIAGLHPSVLGIEDFTELQRPLNLPRTFDQTEYIRWKGMRDGEDSRFVGLTLPRVLMRLPYEDDGSRVDGFRFREDVEGPDRSKYLWGTAIWAFGSVLVRAFSQCAWLADIRGVRQDVEDGGLVTGLPAHNFATDADAIAPKFPTDTIITDHREKELADLGLAPLCACKDTTFAAFYSAQSLQRPKTYDDPAATVNARISSMLQYMLCVSRFAHYVKVLGREKIGSFAEATEFETYVHRWLQKYVTSDEAASLDVKAVYPLREAQVQVRETPGKPGTYMSVVHLRPHFQLDEMVASVKLVTEMTGAS